MYLISGQAHLRLQPAVTLVAAHTKLSLYTVQCMVGKNAFVPQISVGKGAKGLFRAAVSRDIPLNVVVLRDSGALLAFYDFLPPRCYRNYLCRSARQGKINGSKLKDW